MLLRNYPEHDSKHQKHDANDSECSVNFRPDRFARNKGSARADELEPENQAAAANPNSSEKRNEPEGDKLSHPPECAARSACLQWVAREITLQVYETLSPMILIELVSVDCEAFRVVAKTRLQPKALNGGLCSPF